MPFDDLGKVPDPFLLQLAQQFVKSSTDGFSERRELYRDDPVLYCTERLGIPEGTIRWSVSNPRLYQLHKWDGTKDPLVVAMEELRDMHDVAIESGTSTGKTFLAAVIVCWFLECWEDSQVITIAPKADQLKLHMWKELANLWPRIAHHYPKGTLTTLKLRMRGGTDERWTATGFPVQARAGEDAATRAQGFHAEHMLFITEETPGVDEAVMRAIENTCSAPHNLILSLGNPDHRLDTLHKRVETPGVIGIRISALDHPNIVLGDANYIPGAVSQKSVDQRAVRYGVNSKMYKSRVRGICPDQAADALIRLEWIRACQNPVLLEDPRWREGPKAMGVDVANSTDGDLGAWAMGEGAVCDYVKDKQVADANVFGAEMVAVAKAEQISPRFIGIDAIGVGAGAYNEMRRLDYPPYGLMSQSAAVWDSSSQEAFLNLRAQMWWKARLDIQHAKVLIPDDEELVSDLTTPEWTMQGGKIKIKSKQELKELLGRSPNKGDAFVYWNWVRDHPSPVSGFADLIAT